jgi:hypothetical protein
VVDPVGSSLMGHAAKQPHRNFAAPRLASQIVQAQHRNGPRTQPKNTWVTRRCM